MAVDSMYSKPCEFYYLLILMQAVVLVRQSMDAHTVLLPLKRFSTYFS